MFFCHLSGLFTSAPDCFDEFVYIEGKDVDGCVACFSAYLHQKMFLDADSSPQPVYISCISYVHKYVWNVGTSLETLLLPKSWGGLLCHSKRKKSNIHRLII